MILRSNFEIRRISFASFLKFVNLYFNGISVTLIRIVVLRKPSKSLRNCRIFSRQGVLSPRIFHVNPLSLVSFGNTYSIFINRLRKDIFAAYLRPTFHISNLLDQIFMNRRQTVVQSIDYTQNIGLTRQRYQKAMVIVAHVINDKSFGCPIAIGSNFEIVHHDDRFRSLFASSSISSRLSEATWLDQPIAVPLLFHGTKQCLGFPKEDQPLFCLKLHPLGVKRFVAHKELDRKKAVRARQSLFHSPWKHGSSRVNRNTSCLE